MEHHKGVTSDLTTIDSNNNNNSYYHHHNRRKTRTKKQQQLQPLASSKKLQLKSVSYNDPNNISVKIQQQRSMKNSFSWKQRWSQLFSSCGSERVSQVKSIPIAISIEVR
jgi:hypothetical protein